MRHGIALMDDIPTGQLRMSSGAYVKDLRHDRADENAYIRDMASENQVAGQRLATTLRARRAELGWTQERLADEAEVTRQTVIRYESGNAYNPEPTALRRICLALSLDIRQIIIDLGYATRDELEMPAEPDPLPHELDVPVGYWRAASLTEAQRQSLLRHVWASMELWADSMGVTLPEPPKTKGRKAKRPVSAKR